MRAKLVAAFAVGTVLALGGALSDGASTQILTRESFGLARQSQAADADEQNPPRDQDARAASEVLPQEPLPGDFEEQARRRYGSIEEPEATFEQYLEFEKEEFRRLGRLERDRSLRYQPSAKQNLPGVPYEPRGACANGDLETALNAAHWQGAYGAVPGTGNPVFSSFTAGIMPGNSPGPLASANSRQTWVSAGTDPHVGIPLTGPNPSGQPSAGAVRIGNAANGAGAELLSKTFVVTSPQIRFWYAAVLNISGHPSPIAVPSFWVRVTDSAGNVITGAVNLGNGADKLMENDPFLKTNPAKTHMYTDWSCAQINLPNTQVGKTVKVQFVTEDCVRGMHHSYAYLDNFCGACPALPR